MNNDNKDINKITQKLDGLDHHFSKLTESFKRIADVAENLSDDCLKTLIKRPFYKQPSFWTAFIAVSGLIGLLLTSQQQIKAMKANNIRKEIAAIQSFKVKENRAITKSRVLIINQTIDCPVSNNTTLKTMKKARNSALVDITAYGSGLNISENNEAKKNLDAIIGTIYSLKLHEICKINANTFDNKLHGLQVHLNTLVNKSLKRKKTKLYHLENGFIAL